MNASSTRAPLAREPLAIFSSHPGHAERIARIRDFAARHSQVDTPPVALPAFMKGD